MLVGQSMYYYGRSLLFYYAIKVLIYINYYDVYDVH